MSRLRELRLHGFKTFADPTRFVFEPGVNAVIGPNGSGKSNMADAVRWVLGEQSNRSLRTRRADDVIFAGSQHRQPQGMAEAVLTLDNADGWLPIDFGEVSIGRRAYRSGESEYLINGARARLRDVVELLGEGRLGANELVVVGQGTVDAALSLRPEERRQLFEEAAGVKGLQVRKNEAMARLAKARDNLTRITDLIGELRPQVRRLSAQAQHQQEHDGLLLHARALVGESHRRRERAARAGLGEVRRRAAAAEAALESLRAEQQAGQAEQQAAEERYWQAEAAARAAAEQRESTREALIRAESRSDAMAARREELRAAIELGDRELAAARRARAGLVEMAPEAEIAAVLARSTAAEGDWQGTIAMLAAADAELLAAEDALAEARLRDAERLAADARRRETLSATLARRERLERDLAAQGEMLARSQAAVEAARTALSAADAQEDAAHRRMLAVQAALATAQQAADATRLRAAQLAGQAETVRGELAALRERTEGGNRLGALLAAGGWSTLLDAVAAPEETWPAIEALVGGELGEALLWRDQELSGDLDVGRGVARLLAGGPAAAGRSAAAEREAALRAVGATRTVAEWAGAADVPAIFHRAVVAADLAALLRGWRDLPAGWSAVTVQGDLADARGVLTLRGRAEPAGGSAARAHARRRELAERMEALSAEELQAAATTEGAASELERLRRELAEVRHAHEEAERVTRRARAEADLVQANRERGEREAAELDTQLRRARAAEATAGSTPDARTPGDGQLDRLTLAVVEARRRRDTVAAERDSARAGWQEARAAAEAVETSSVGQRRERGLLEARVVQHEAALPTQRAVLATIEQESTTAGDLLAAAHTRDGLAARARAAADAERERLRAELLAKERGSGAAAARFGELERDAQASAIEASRQEDALSALERERELALESLPEADEPSTVGQSPESEDPQLFGMDEASLDTELRRVRRTLGQIGSVNPFAVEEHRELAARLDDVSTQDGDLRGAIGSTEELLGRLDAEIADKFNLAFSAIGDRFDEFYRLLFAGGSAALQMSDDSDGSDGIDGESPGGIEIVVRPPGKRPQRLAMLSGGERALTGVALLFAMLSVNPVPFCILDEVDAALDEANIGRFADALRKLSETIDFVVITHNRATMEVADTIYGVTMTDAAVSRILSLRLTDLPVEVHA